MTQFDPFARQAHAASISGHSAFLVPPVFFTGLGPRTAARATDRWDRVVTEEDPDRLRRNARPLSGDSPWPRLFSGDFTDGARVALLIDCRDGKAPQVVEIEAKTVTPRPPVPTAAGPTPQVQSPPAAAAPASPIPDFEEAEGLADENARLKQDLDTARFFQVANKVEVEMYAEKIDKLQDEVEVKHLEAPTAECNASCAQLRGGQFD